MDALHTVFCVIPRRAGMRMRAPQSPLLGVMWVDPGRQDPLNNIRHEAQQRDGKSSREMIGVSPQGRSQRALRGPGGGVQCIPSCAVGMCALPRSGLCAVMRCSCRAGRLARCAALRCAARFVHTRRLPWACCAGLKQYGWLQHDGESYGLQQLHDEEYNITTAWVSCSLAGRRAFGKYASRGRAAGSLRVFYFGLSWGARLIAKQVHL